MKDYYGILGINEGAGEEEIRQAYKKLAMKHHPDRGGDQAQFQEVQEAYSTLTDPNRRAQWEQQRAFGNGGHPGGFNFAFNFGGDINDFFRSFHSPFGHVRPQPQNRDHRTRLDISLASTLNQQDKHIDVRHQDGTVKTVQVTIPRGVQTGMQMRVPGAGDHAIKNLPPGDLYIDIVVTAAPGFEINGINLHKKLTINCIDAVLGTISTVVGIDNRQFNITIPAGSQQGTLFRMAAQGLWDINQPVRGDLLIELNLEVPRSITKVQLENLQRLV